jgi:hypothetical protein
MPDLYEIPVARQFDAAKKEEIKAAMLAYYSSGDIPLPMEGERDFEYDERAANWKWGVGEHEVTFWKHSKDASLDVSVELDTGYWISQKFHFMPYWTALYQAYLEWLDEGSDYSTRYSDGPNREEFRSSKMYHEEEFFKVFLARLGFIIDQDGYATGHTGGYGSESKLDRDLDFFTWKLDTIPDEFSDLLEADYITIVHDLVWFDHEDASPYFLSEASVGCDRCGSYWDTGYDGYKFCRDNSEDCLDDLHALDESDFIFTFWLPILVPIWLWRWWAFRWHPSYKGRETTQQQVKEWLLQIQPRWGKLNLKRCNVMLFSFDSRWLRLLPVRVNVWRLGVWLKLLAFTNGEFVGRSLRKLRIARGNYWHYNKYGSLISLETLLAKLVLRLLNVSHVADAYIRFFRIPKMLQGGENERHRAEEMRTRLKWRSLDTTKFTSTLSHPQTWWDPAAKRYFSFAGVDYELKAGDNLDVEVGDEIWRFTFGALKAEPYGVTVTHKTKLARLDFDLGYRSRIQRFLNRRIDRCLAARKVIVLGEHEAICPNCLHGHLHAYS